LALYRVQAMAQGQANGLFRGECVLRDTAKPVRTALIDELRELQRQHLQNAQDQGMKIDKALKRLTWINNILIPAILSWLVLA
jgi:hypothetical protein